VTASQLRILQNNLHKHKTRTHAILNDHDTKDFTILMLQEPYYWTDKESNTQTPPHHAWLRYLPTSNEAPPRAATYVSKAQVNAAQVTQIQLPFSDVVAIKINLQDQTDITIVNVYNPCDDSLIQRLHKSLEDAKINHKGRILLAGDFNSHHPLWNPPRYYRHDESANDILDLAKELGLNLLSPPGIETYPQAHTTIDLTWGSISANKELLKCKVSHQYDFGSDHLPIETVIDVAPAHKPEEPKLDLSRTDWELFTKALQIRLKGIPTALTTPDAIDRAVAQLTSAIQLSLTDTTPVKKPTPHSKRWWKKGLTELRKEAKKLRKKYQSSGREVDREKWRKKANEYTDRVDRAKEDTWREFLANVDGKTVWDVKKYIEGGSGYGIIPTLNGCHATHQELTQALQKSFFPPAPPADLTDLPNDNHPKPVRYEPTITIYQIQKAVRRVAPNKAPGPDGITNKVLKQALPDIEKLLQTILQASINLSYFPRSLKETTTIVLRKPGKPDYTVVKAYRPIALENTIGKIFESVIAEIMSYLTEKNELLPEHHYGGRPGRSTEDAMLALSESIYNAWKRNQVYSAVFLDVAGAFNNVHHIRLIDNLQKRKMPESITKWITSFLSHRTTRLSFNGAMSEPIDIQAGVPQGSPLSPLLYMFYNADLLDIPKRTKDLAMGFIDDVVYGVGGPTDRANARRLKGMLKEAEKWRISHGAQFEQSKYILVHFTRNRHRATKARISINGTTIKPSEDARYLGVIFDSKLRFKAHIQYAIKKGTTAALALGSIGRTTWGVPYEHLRLLYQSTVTTRMDYGAIIWHRPQSNNSAAASTTQAKKFATVQRIATKAILGCYRTTPTVAMDLESDIPPPWIRLRTKALTATTRIRSLAKRHPIHQWIDRAHQRVTASNIQIHHISNLESIMSQFPSTQSEVQEIKPFKGKPPWLPDTQSNKQTNSSTRLTTKEAQRSEIKKLATETLCEAWNKDTAAPHLRKIIGPIQSKPPGRDLYNSAPNRKIAAALAQLRTGHCGLNYYLWRFKKIESSKCEGCGYERETVEHYLLECPKFREERRKLRDKIGGVGKMKVKTLLGDKKIIGRTMEFVTNTKRFMEEQREKNGEQKHL
jgi:endonuclease/exonuclease/phosphatase (EEP) superfamily protein YafD